MTYGVDYNHQTVTLDGEAFQGCEFTACRMVYSGGPVPQFEDCRFSDCEWIYGQAAADTLSYLKLLWNVGAKTSVQATIKEITAAR